MRGRSRGWRTGRRSDRRDGGADYTEIVVANDGLSVILNPENDWATDLTVEQLATIWAPGSAGKIVNWNQVDPGFPDQPLVLFGAGKDSGTLDYFSDAINGEEGAIRADYSASEDDNLTVEGVAESLGGTTSSDRDRQCTSSPSAAATRESPPRSAPANWTPPST